MAIREAVARANARRRGMVIDLTSPPGSPQHATISLSDDEDHRFVRPRLTEPKVAPEGTLHVNGGFRLAPSAWLHRLSELPTREEAEVVLRCETGPKGEPVIAAFLKGDTKPSCAPGGFGVELPGLSTPESQARTRRIGTLMRVAAAELSAAIYVGAPLLHVSATLRSSELGGAEATSHGPIIWLEVRAPDDAPPELVEALAKTAACAHITDASTAIALGASLGVVPRVGREGWVCQPIGAHTAEWARAHLPTSISASVAPFVYVGGAALPAEARAKQPPRREHRLLAGKWLVFVEPLELDECWVVAAGALHAGLLGPAMKAVTCGPEWAEAPGAAARGAQAGRPGQAVAWRKPLIVYCQDFTDEQDVKRVGLALGAALRITRGAIVFKPDVFTLSECGFKSIFSLDLATGTMTVRADALKRARAMAGLDLNQCATGSRLGPPAPPPPRLNPVEHASGAGTAARGAGGAMRGGAPSGGRAGGAGEPPYAAVPAEPESDWESGSDCSSLSS